MEKHEENYNDKFKLAVWRQRELITHLDKQDLLLNNFGIGNV